MTLKRILEIQTETKIVYLLRHAQKQTKSFSSVETHKQQLG